RLDGSRLRERDAELLEAVTRGVRRAAERAHERVELEARLAARVLAYQRAAGLDAERAVAGAHVDALGGEALAYQRRGLGVLACQQPRQHLHLRHARAEAREGLRELAADRPATEHHHASRQLAQIPEGFGGQHARPLDARQRRHDRPRTRRDDDGAGAQRLPAVDGDGPRRSDARLTLQALDTKLRITLDRIVRRDGPHDALNALHHLGEIEA